MGDLEGVLSRAEKWIAHFDENKIPEGARLGAYSLEADEVYAFWLGCVGSGRVPVLLNDKLPIKDLAPFLRAVPLHAVVAPDACEFSGRVIGLPTGEKVKRWDEPRDEATALIVFTSGSSGDPKGVSLSWANLKASAEATAAFYDVKRGEKWFSPLPLFHVGGFMVFARAWFTGLVPVTCGGSDALAVLLETKRPEWISLVPTQLGRLLDEDRARSALRKARGILLGGADTPLWLRQRIEREKFPVSYTYGMSEAASQIAATHPGEPAEAMRILPRREACVMADGRFAFRGDVRFQGYWSEGRFADPSDAEGWFVTQDAAELSSAGTLKILGRADEIFQCGGENIAPSGIERVLGDVMPQASLVVCPLLDEHYGFVPVLVIVSPERPESGAVGAHIQEKLASFFRPRAVYWHPSDGTRLKPPRGVWREAFRKGAPPQELTRIL